MVYPTPLLDRLHAQHRHQQEQKRLTTLAKTRDWLADNAQHYGIQQAYLIGSLIRPNQFTSRSDVDLAVEEIAPHLFFQAMADLSEWLERDVDIIVLSHCPFAGRLRQQGIPWTPLS